MHIRRLLPPLVVSSFLLISILLFPTWQQVGPFAAEAGTTTTVRYVANNGADADACTTPDAPCETLQHAVDVANAGDEILLAAGTFSDIHARAGITQVVYISKSLSIRGGFGPGWAEPAAAHRTVLDARGMGRVVYVTGSVTVTLENMSIIGGVAGQTTSRLSVGNIAAGGGVYVGNATFALKHSEVVSNAAEWGGGIFIADGSLRMMRTRLSDNAAFAAGGALRLERSDSVLLNNIFSGNSAADFGGALSQEGGVATLVGAHFRHNSAGSGGALEVHSNGLLSLNSSNVEDNSADARGGGIDLANSTGIFTNTIFARNQISPTGVGAGMHVAGSSLTLQHATIVENSGGDGSGLYVTEDQITTQRPSTPIFSTVDISNTIIVGHEVGLFVSTGNTVTTEGMLWGSATTGNILDWSGSGNILTGTKNIRLAPQFAGLNNYHLRLDSPAVDAAIPTGNPIDVDGNRRPYPGGGSPDIGADEVPYGRLAPSQAWNFVYTDTDNITVSMNVPAGGVLSPTRIAFLRQMTPGHEITEGLRFAGVAFDLDAFTDEEAPEKDFQFEQPVTMTLRYHDEDIAGIDESSLTLYFWNGTRWQDIAQDCGTTYTRNVSRNMLQVQICHLSRYGMHGSEKAAVQIFLPAILR